MSEWWWHRWAPCPLVVLRVDSGRWPAGTVGTVVERLDAGAIVEIIGEGGCTLDMLSLPYATLQPLDDADQGGG